MHEPNLRTSRLAISGGLVAAIAVAGAGFLIGRTTSPRPEPAPVATVAPVPVAPPPPRIETPRTVGRADIIGFADRAADALAAGAPLPDDVTAIAGRRFELVLPFGCSGAAPEGSTVSPRWSYDPDRQTLRIHAAPTAWDMGDWGAAAAPDGAPRRLEGFWVSRPWSSSEQCPQGHGQAAAVNGQPVTLPGQTLAVAELATGERRRERRAYETVQRVPADRFDASQGFRLRLIGRIDRLPGGQPVQCVQPAGIEQRPICLVTVALDEIRIENPVGNETLATWSMRPAS